MGCSSNFLPLGHLRSPSDAWRLEYAFSGSAIRACTLKDDQTTVAELTALVARFVAERDWEQFHDPKNLSASIAIEAAELMEHFQWLRSDELNEIANDPKAIGEIREEVADILAYLLSFASRMKIDLSSALADKMARNAVKYPADQFRGKFKR